MKCYNCGWSSVMEAMKFVVPIIAIPMLLDQPINAQLVVEIGMGKEVVEIGMGKEVVMNNKWMLIRAKQDVAFLFDSNYYRKYEKKNVKEILESSTNGRKDKDRVMQGVKWWKNIVLVKSFEEIEGIYANYLSGRSTCG
ncbi:beta-D-glucosyl crocetin beta-1,6-glucosyltransferase-like protein [Tanacetum coccineum]